MIAGPPARPLPAIRLEQQDGTHLRAGGGDPRCLTTWRERREETERTTIHGPSGVQAHEREKLPPVGQSGLASFGLAIGLVLVAIQLWLLTIAFDLYLQGERGATVGVAVSSGLVFAGGLLMLRAAQPTARRDGAERWHR